MFLRVTGFAGLMAGLLLTTGCGNDGRVGVYKTSGKLVRTGPPVTGLSVIFHPADGSASATPTLPIGIVQSDGTFLLTSYNVGDGASPGEYIVVIAEAPRDSSVPKPAPPPLAYLSVKTSPLRAKIEKKPLNELEPFDISK